MKFKYGPCCACGGKKRVRNIVSLARRAPVPGTGWGCVVCGLEADGALAIICDECAKNVRPIKQVAYGYLAEGRRMSIDLLSSETFEHRDHEEHHP
jgi:hypothetical protein